MLAFWLIGLVGWLTSGEVRFEDIVGKPDEAEEIWCVSVDRLVLVLFNDVTGVIEGEKELLVGADGNPDIDGADVTLALALGNPDVGEDIIDIEGIIVAVLFDGTIRSPDEGLGATVEVRIGPVMLLDGTIGSPDEGPGATVAVIIGLVILLNGTGIPDEGLGGTVEVRMGPVMLLDGTAGRPDEGLIIGLGATVEVKIGPVIFEN